MTTLTKLIAFTLVGLSLVNAGCGSLKVDHGLKNNSDSERQARIGDVGAPIKIEQTGTSWAWGLYNINASVNAQSLCRKKNWIWVKMERSRKQTLYSILTLGIYNPYKYSVLCEPQDAW